MYFAPCNYNKHKKCKDRLQKLNNWQYQEMIQKGVTISKKLGEETMKKIFLSIILMSI